MDAFLSFEMKGDSAIRKHYETNAFQIYTRIGKREQVSMLRINNGHCITAFSDSHMKIFGLL